MIRPAPNTAPAGILLALGGSAVMSLNDLAIKRLSGDYPLHEVILVRASVGLLVLFALMWWSGGGLQRLTTRKPLLHLIRVGFVLISNVAYFTALAAMPLSDAVAIGFMAPLFVTVLSIPFLGEKVGPHRWAAVAAGLLGVLIISRVGSGTIQPAALLAILSAACYAMMHIMTRRMKGSESVLTMSLYVQIGFVIVSLLMGVIAGDGKFAGSGDASLDFLLRAWSWPPLSDLPWFLMTGLAVAVGGLMISQAYKLCEAALVAPFEYAAMPLAILWGIVVFSQWPDGTAWIGIALICGAGLYTLWRETVRRKGRHGSEGSGI